MKKFLFILMIILIAPAVSSAEIEFLKNSDSFDQGETLISVVSGNFIDQITRDNVLFYHDHVRIPMDYEVKKIEGEFYIYAQLVRKSEGNYSVVISGVRYMLGVETTDEDIVLPFTITNDTADFYVSPGFISDSKNFSIDVRNLKSTKITISIDSSNFLDSENSIELVSGEIKKINFGLTESAYDEESFFEKIKFSSGNNFYEVPVFIKASKEEPGEEIDEENETTKDISFKFEPGIENISLATNSDSRKIFYLINTGEGLVENIDISVSSSLEPYVNVSPSNISMLNNGSVQKIEIFVVSGEDEGEIEGTITAISENFTASFRLNLYFVRDFVPEDEEESKNGIITTCSQLEGLICGSNEECTGKTNSAKDGICCLAPAVCEEISESNTGKIIGWSLVLFVILLLSWFFWKYKRARPKADILSIGRR